MSPGEETMILVVNAETLREAAALIDDLQGWIFRGQANASWDLQSTLERAELDNAGHLRYAAGREEWLAYQFQRRAYHYVSQPPDNFLEWEALMRHYGAPTRVVDFSRSFYVSAFFAFEKSKDGPTIWAINYDHLVDQTSKKFGKKKKSLRQYRIEQTAGIANEFLRGKGSKPTSGKASRKWCVPAEPYRLNERMATQQGVFLVPQGVQEPFMDHLGVAMGTPNLASTISAATPKSAATLTGSGINDAILLKIVLPKDHKALALRQLHKMNITAATIFPGLDGFARSLEYYCTVSKQVLNRLRKTSSRETF